MTDYTKLTRQDMIAKLNVLERLAETLAKKPGVSVSRGPWIGNLGNWYLNPKTGAVVCSSEALEALGFAEEEIHADEEIDVARLRQLVHPDDMEKMAEHFKGLLDGNVQDLEVSYRIQSKNGTWLWFYSKGHVLFRYTGGTPELVSGSTFDITEQKRIEDLLVYQSMVITELETLDPMTKTRTRNVARDLIAQKIKEGGESSCLSVLMLGIDNFKRVNQDYGHAVGDEILREVVRIIDANVDPNNLVGRYSGTEFLVPLSGCTQDASALLSKICNQVAETSFTSGARITMSGGFQQYTNETVDELIEAAARHMYEMSLGHTGS